MEIFGRRWENYMKRLETNWHKLVSENDTVVIPGDVSWALSLEEATSDLLFIEALPGKKILGKGNHDFWWSTMKKHTEHFEKHGIKSISFLFNNAHETDEYIVAGTRGWFWEEKLSTCKNNADFEKLTAREELRLRTSLQHASKLREESGKEIVVFTHFPPVWCGTVSEGLVRALNEYSVKKVYYGHIHGNYTVPSVFTYQDISMRIISADYLDFIPKIVN